MALIDCPDCGARVSKSADKCPRCARPFPKNRIGCICVLIAVALSFFFLCLVVAWIAANGDGRATGSQQLELLSWNWERLGDGSYVQANGEIANLGSRPIENVRASVSYYNSDGELITSDDALVEYNPIMPGQVSPWKVITRGNPQMISAKVRFTTFRGRTLDVKYPDRGN